MRAEEKYMRMALDEAEAALSEGETPVGAVIVRGDEIVARAHNSVEAEGDARFHAELAALSEAAKKLGTRYLDDCVLYVTMEPCPMCAVCGALGSRCDLGNGEYGRGFPAFGGMLEEECAEILKNSLRINADGHYCLQKSAADEQRGAFGKLRSGRARFRDSHGRRLYRPLLFRHGHNRAGARLTRVQRWDNRSAGLEERRAVPRFREAAARFFGELGEYGLDGKPLHELKEEAVDRQLLPRREGRQQAGQGGYPSQDEPSERPVCE